LRRKGFPTYRLVRYADDLVVCVKGTREQAEALLSVLAGLPVVTEQERTLTRPGAAAGRAGWWLGSA